jgi:hypothetical protein
VRPGCWESKRPSSSFSHGAFREHFSMRAIETSGGDGCKRRLGFVVKRPQTRGKKLLLQAAAV